MTLSNYNDFRAWILLATNHPRGVLCNVVDGKLFTRSKTSVSDCHFVFIKLALTIEGVIKLAFKKGD